MAVILSKRDNHDGGIGGGWVFLIVVIIILAVAAGGWIVYARLRAKRLGLPPPPINPFASSRGSGNYPSPAPGGVRGWIEARIRSLKNRRSAAGSYEATGLGSGHPSNRSRNTALDPDEAWDTRVGNEVNPYYEEQELGLHSGPNTYSAGPYTGGGYGEPAPRSAGLAAPYEEERGRSRSRSPAGGPVGRALDERYDEEMGVSRGGRDPFADDVERSDISLRGVSPRPLDTRQGGGHDPEHESPTERRSMFRENM